MEKVSICNSKGIKISCNTYFVESDSVVIMSHGFASCKNAHGRFDEIATYYLDNQISSITFDFSGCGESGGEILTLPNMIDDLKTIIRYVQRIGYKRINLLAHSLGGLISLLAYSKEITTIVLLGPLMGPRDFTQKKYYSDEQLVELEKYNYFTLEKGGDNRERVRVDGKLNKSLAKINAKIVCNKVKCPVQIMHGDLGEIEAESYKITMKSIKYLPEFSEVVILKEADHSFMSCINEVKYKSLSWIKKFKG